MSEPRHFATVQTSRGPVRFHTVGEPIVEVPAMTGAAVAVHDAVRSAIREMKRNGTVGASAECIEANISPIHSRAFTVSVAWYRANIGRIIREEAAALRFKITSSVDSIQAVR